MSRQTLNSPAAKRQRCGKCLRPSSVCYCSQIPCQQINNWPVYIIQDVRESSHAIGTARIAALSLSNCQLIAINPDKDMPSTAIEALRLLRPVLVYPGEDARDMSELRGTPEAPLLFIDASWRRSRKILLTQPWIADLPRYALAAGQPSRYRIRRQPALSATSSAMSTLEAVVCTLQQLETGSARFDSLLATMDWVVDQQIEHMGSDVWQSNYSKFNKES